MSKMTCEMVALGARAVAAASTDDAIGGREREIWGEFLRGNVGRLVCGVPVQPTGAPLNHGRAWNIAGWARPGWAT